MVDRNDQSPSQQEGEQSPSSSSDSSQSSPSQSADSSGAGFDYWADYRPKQPKF